MHPKLPSVTFYPRQVLMDATFAVVLIGILAIIAIKIPMDLGPAANPADTHFRPRPDWYYRPAFQWLRYFSGRWYVAGIVLPAILALVFAAVPFLDRSTERRPWRRPISVGAFLIFLIAYISLGVASYRADYSDPGMAAQMHKQDEDVKAFMQKPFTPESKSCCRNSSGCAGFRCSPGIERTSSISGRIMRLLPRKRRHRHSRSRSAYGCWPVYRRSVGCVASRAKQ